MQNARSILADCEVQLQDSEIEEVEAALVEEYEVGNHVIAETVDAGSSVRAIYCKRRHSGSPQAKCWVSTYCNVDHDFRRGALSRCP